MVFIVQIDPASITEDNVASVLGALVVEIQNMNNKIDEKMDITNRTIDEKIGNLSGRLIVIENTLREHENMFWGPFRFSRCDLFPFIWRHKWLLLLLWTLLSVWVSAIDYVVKSL